MDHIPQFNQKQLEYFRDTDFLISKRKIIEQLQNLLITTERDLVKLVEQEKPDVIPENCLVTAGKISRGENYRGLPYLVLDYPRLFNKKDIFSFRTMCWWGNFFSCTLHLQGTVLEQFRPNLKRSLITDSTPPNTYICVNKTPWEYHYGTDNYQLLNSLQESEITHLLEQNFVKISRKIELEEYNTLPHFASNCFLEFMRLLN